jgi:hypothetical protein
MLPLLGDTRECVDQYIRSLVLRRLSLELFVDLSGVVDETDPKVGAA